MNKKLKSNHSQIYYFKNCIRMGETKQLRPIDTSVVLYHNGLNAILSHNQHAQLHGHCVFYKSRCLISAQYLRNRIINIAYRTDGYLLYLNYNEQSKLDGQCYLMCFPQRIIYGASYESGLMRTRRKLSKVENESVEDIFDYNDLVRIAGTVHAKALNHQALGIERIKTVKKGNKAEIFYCLNPALPLTTGLGFVFFFRSPQHGGYDPETNKYGDQFELKFVEKGQYSNQLLDGYGQRSFKNNNFYEGYFVKNCFEGEGVLQDYKNSSWVYGIFQYNQLKDMLDFSNESIDDMVKMDMILQKIREKQRYYVNSFFQEPDFSYLDAELERIISVEDVQVIHLPTIEEKKQMILDKIAKSYMESATLTKNISKTPESKLKDSQKEKPSKMKINSLLPPNANPKEFIFRNNTTLSNSTLKKATFQPSPEKIDPDPTTARGGKTLSKIFKKDYSHIQNTTPRDTHEGFLKLQMVESSSPNSPYKSINQRLRKSVIFGNKTTRDGFTPNKHSYSPSPLSRRSPRKTTIFETDVKFRDFKQDKDDLNDGNLNLKKLESIRKISPQKKYLLATQKNSRRVSNNTIFQRSKQKSTESKIFNYL